MNSSEARQILLRYRPGSSDASDPPMAEALGLVKRDEALRHWFEQHCAWQAAMRAKFQQIEVPAHLKAGILARQKIVRPGFWRRKPVWLAAAAAIVLFLGLISTWMKPRAPDRFADFQGRMVRTALREYHMDVVTNEMRPVRQYLAEKGAPSDYDLPNGLARLQLTGGGLLRWRSNPVAMVCFNRGDGQMLFLFVLNRSAVNDPPPATPQVARVNKLLTASWTRDDKTYILAGPEEAEFIRKYF